MDKYFIIHNWERADVDAGRKPMIGIYDKWHPDNGNWVPGSGDGSDPKPVNPDLPPEEEGGGVFWVIFSILALAITLILLKLYGK